MIRYPDDPVVPHIFLRHKCFAVTVTAERGTDDVKIRVADDGVGLPPSWTLESSLGTGLSVTRERILGLHPDGNSRFFVRPRDGGGTEVGISLPLRFAGAS